MKWIIDQTRLNSPGNQSFQPFKKVIGKRNGPKRFGIKIRFLSRFRKEDNVGVLPKSWGVMKMKTAFIKKSQKDKDWPGEVSESDWFQAIWPRSFKRFEFAQRTFSQQRRNVLRIFTLNIRRFGIDIWAITNFSRLCGVRKMRRGKNLQSFLTVSCNNCLLYTSDAADE